MTYARARLWLGISGVGTICVLAFATVFTRWHEAIMPQMNSFADDDIWSLSAFLGAFLVVMLPFDLLGGFVLPNRFQKQSISFARFFGPWLIGVILQSCLFMVSGLTILTVGRLFGIAGVLVLLALLCVAYLALQGQLLRMTVNGTPSQPRAKLGLLRKKLRQWNFQPRPLLALNHSDPGFTGGIVGLPGRETIVIPRSWFEQLTDVQLATAVSRRLIAIETSSRNRGLILALLWVLSGFAAASWLPGAGVTNIAELITTCAGFTLWTFFGLLVLPTVSRRASYAIDSELVHRGVPEETLDSTLAVLDQFQDDEPERPQFIETIFHPVPSVANRRGMRRKSTTIGAWHTARMVLFLSWSCLGLLSRAVHCNAGRPELWVMPPTD